MEIQFADFFEALPPGSFLERVNKLELFVSQICKIKECLSIFGRADGAVLRKTFHISRSQKPNSIKRH